MEGPMILALIVGIPIILFPAAFVWYLNIEGILMAAKQAREAKAARSQVVTEKAD